MRLRDALKRALSFVDKDADVPAHRGVWISPAGPQVDGMPGTPPCVVATDGDVGIWIFLDEDPGHNIVLDATGLAESLKGTRTTTVLELSVRGPDRVLVSGGVGSHVVQLYGEKGRPPLPRRPEYLTPVTSFQGLFSVVHARARGREAEDLGPLTKIHMTRTHVEAADRSRVARAQIPLPLDGGILVDHRVFDAWPTRDRKSPLAPALGVRDGTLFVHVLDEVRWAPVDPDIDYYDLDPLLPPAHQGHAVTVPRELATAVKHGLAASAHRGVELRFGDGDLSVVAYADGGTKSYASTFTDVGEGPDAAIVVDGRRLWESLRAHEKLAGKDSPIRIRYLGPVDPIRVEYQGTWWEAIWPMVAAEG